MALRRVSRIDLKLGDLVISTSGPGNNWRGANEAKGLGWVVYLISHNPFQLKVRFNDKYAEEATGSMAEFYHILESEPVNPEWGEVAP